MPNNVIQLPYTSAQIQSLLARVNSLDTEFETRLNELYSVGSIYIGTGDQCPIAVLGVGTWQLVATDKVLQGAGTRGSVGTSLDESLPNIKGKFGSWDNKSNYGWNMGEGCFAREQGTSSYRYSSVSESNSDVAIKMTFEASRSSSTYQDDAPVQQDAYLVNIWERIA